MIHGSFQRCLNPLEIFIHDIQRKRIAYQTKWVVVLGKGGGTQLVKN